jgi:hypothetical protein
MRVPFPLSEKFQSILGNTLALPVVIGSLVQTKQDNEAMPFPVRKISLHPNRPCRCFDADLTQIIFQFVESWPNPKMAFNLL